MSDLPARDFHIGSELRWNWGSGPKQFDVGVVRSASGGMILMEYTAHGITMGMGRPLCHCVHPDGAPLGEWVPIDPEAHSAYIGGYDTEPCLTLDDANAIIRGELQC